MGAEIGATSLAVPLRRQHGRVPQGHRPRGDRRRRRRASPSDLRADPEVDADPSVLRPGHRDRPRRARAAHRRPAHPRPRPPDRREVGAAAARARAARSRSRSALVGSCTNSSYEDITRAASIARQAAATGLTAKTQLLITPGSEQVRATIERDGLLADLEAIGATVLANACGPCIGQWERDRHRPRRASTRSSTRSTATSRSATTATPTRSRSSTSPETVIALALAGTLDFDPPTDTLTDADGSRGAARAAGRRGAARAGLRPGRDAASSPRRPTARGVEVVVVARLSDRLQLLEPFPAWDGNDYRRPAGADEGAGQVHHRPHLAGRAVAEVPRPPREHLAATCSSASSTRSPARPATGKDPLDGETRHVPRHRQALQRGRHRAGCAVGDENYGEGSSREHAAMEPRFRGGRGDLRPQLRPHPRDQPEEAGRAAAHVRRPGDLRPDRRGRPHHRARPRRPRARRARCACRIVKPDGTTIDFEGNHTFSDEQIEWFQAGGALNIIRGRATPSRIVGRRRLRRPISRCRGASSSRRWGRPCSPTDRCAAAPRPSARAARGPRRAAAP